MAKTIDFLTLMVDMTPYEYEGHNYDALNIIVAYRKGQGFVNSWQPVKRQPTGYMTGPMPSSDPLVGGKGFVVKEASRNNVKTLETMQAALLTAKEGIKFFFDQRNYESLKEFMGDVCNYGYTQEAEKRLQETISAISEVKESENNSNQEESVMKTNQDETQNVQNAQVNNPIEPINEAPVSVGSALPTVTFTTYKTKKGDTAPMIIGFGEDDPRWKAHKESGAKWVSASYRRDINGEKVYILLFGVRYMDVAKALCGAYNTDDKEAWKRAENACEAIHEQAMRDGKAKWEAKKAEWKAKKEEEKAQKEADKKCYTKEDVAAMLNNLLSGGDVPEEIKKLLKAA